MNARGLLRIVSPLRRLPWRSIRILGAGFVMIIILIIALIGVSLHSMSDVRQNLDRLSAQLQSKDEALSVIRENLYLRLASSRDMMAMEDAFSIDEEAQRFHIYASRIGRAYDRFLELTDDPVERSLAEKFMDQARIGMPLLNSTIDELLAGRRPNEIQTLLNQAFDSQKQALDTLHQLQDHAQRQSLLLTQEAVARYERTRILILVLTSITILLVLAIAMVVARLMNQHTEELERQRRRYKTLFDANRDAVLIVQGERIVEGNRRALEWFDYDGRGKLRGALVDSLSSSHGDSNTRNLNGMLELMSTHGGSFEWTFRGRDGQPFFGEVSLSPLPVLTGNRLQVVIHDITERTLELRQMSHDASHDPMTGLANRREFERRVNLAIESARTLGSHHALGYLDLDKFKDVNDLAGHAAGDELLKQVAAVFKQHIRAADLVARLGGDEFGLLLENCASGRASDIVRKITDEIESLSCQTSSGNLRIGVSVGLVEISATSPNYDRLVQLADQACYEAKRAGTGFSHATATRHQPLSGID